MQDIARNVLKYLDSAICPDDTERSIAVKAAGALSNNGIFETWYYDCPALVLLGSRSCLSISGRNYRPAEEPVGETNLVTVDLSPMSSGYWADCARSFYIENGKPTPDPILEEFARGKRFLETLHSDMQQFVREDVTFHHLYEWSNSRIADEGFQNLDFLGNVGHSIAMSRADRQFIERGNHNRLIDIPCFTFEPHVRASDGRWGFKHENIFYFDDRARLSEL